MKFKKIKHRIKHRIKHKKEVLRAFLFVGGLIFIFTMLSTVFPITMSHDDSVIAWIKPVFYSGVLTAAGIISISVKARVRSWLIWATFTSWLVFQVLAFIAYDGFYYLIPSVSIISIPAVLVPMFKLLKFKSEPIGSKNKNKVYQ